MDIKISQFVDESNTVFNFRKNFIINNKDELINKGCDNNTIIKYSKILANIKYKGCKYDSIIYNKIKHFF
jgi:hypothetical protein